MKKLILLGLVGLALTGCVSNGGYSQSYNTYNNNDVVGIHNRLDGYERNARISSVYNQMNYNTNRGMGF